MVGVGDGVVGAVVVGGGVVAGGGGEVDDVAVT